MALSHQASQTRGLQRLPQKIRNVGKAGAAFALRIRQKLMGISRRQILTAVTIGVLSISLLYVAGFFWPRTVTFSYSGGNCFFNPVILPNLVSKEPGRDFTIATPPSLSIGGYPLFSVSTCVNLANIPNQSETLKIAPFSNPVFKKNVTVQPGSLPTAHALLPPQEPAAPDTPLAFNLSQADRYFDYRLQANNKHETCHKDGTKLSCNLAGLTLLQGTEYPVKLERIFNSVPTGPVLEQTIRTVEPVAITHSSIAPGEKVFGVPPDVIFTFSKPIASYEGLALKRLGETLQELPITPVIEGQNLIVRFNEALPRNANFELALAQVRAQDGSRLPGAHIQQFATSGGPKVQSVNIGDARVQPDSPLTLTFDAAIAPNQDLQHFIRLEAGGSRINATLAVNDKSITISPRGLNRCTVFNIQVIDGLQNFAGITGGSAWRFASRTVCQTTFSIGTSVQGRGITGYRFGSGPSKVIIVGTLHGNEKSATHTLNAFINQLEANFDRIPANRTVIVIPNANPDGFAANTRTNAHNVDLNRNFPANGWKPDVTMPNGTFLPGGGGASPLSEPESRAVANFIASQGARLVLSFHSVAGLVAANEAGDSLAIGRLYGQKSNFPAYGNEAGSSFHYDTTGAFEDWLRDAHGIPGLLVELSTQASNEINRHQDALWAMVQLQ